MSTITIRKLRKLRRGGWVVGRDYGGYGYNTKAPWWLVPLLWLVDKAVRE